MTSHRLATIALAAAALTGTSLGFSHAASAQSDEGRQVRGTVTAVHGTRLTLKLDNGATLSVDDSSAGAVKVAVGEHVAVIGAFDAHKGPFHARMITTPGNSRSVSGTVVSRSGSRLSLRSDAGQTIAADVLSAELTGPVHAAVGQHVTLTGGYSENSIFYADEVAASAGVPQATPVPAAPGTAGDANDEGRQIRGTITAIEGSRLTLRLDNGVTAVVDDSAAGASGLAVGKHIAVIGAFDSHKGPFHARLITQPGNARTITGTVVSRSGSRLTLRSDAGQTIAADVLSAELAGPVPAAKGQHIALTGGYSEQSVFYADTVVAR